MYLLSLGKNKTFLRKMQVTLILTIILRANGVNRNILNSFVRLTSWTRTNFYNDLFIMAVWINSTEERLAIYSANKCS